MFKLISRFIFQILVNGLGILAISYIIEDVFFSGGWFELLEIAVVLAILNVLLKPVLKLIFGPLIFLTLGIFILILNAAILWVVVWLFPEYIIIPWGWSLIWATLIISLINFIFNTSRK
jgi:putative membrane protein